MYNTRISKKKKKKLKMFYLIQQVVIFRNNALLTDNFWTSFLYMCVKNCAVEEKFLRLQVKILFTFITLFALLTKEKMFRIFLAVFLNRCVYRNRF